jgi:hypothetical protein
MKVTVLTSYREMEYDCFVIVVIEISIKVETIVIRLKLAALSILLILFQPFRARLRESLRTHSRSNGQML